MRLPQFQSDDVTMQLLQNKWAAILNPIIANPATNASILKNVQLLTGLNTIPHLLGKELQGWVVVRQRAAANIYDTQDTNQMPRLTLLLNASAPVTVDLMVF